MTERAEGFWWVRLAEAFHEDMADGCGVLLYTGGERSPVLFVDRDGEADYTVHYHSAVEEWIRYLGKTAELNAGPVVETPWIPVKGSGQSRLVRGKP